MLRACELSCVTRAQRFGTPGVSEAAMAKRQHEKRHGMRSEWVRDTKGTLAISSMSWIVDDASDRPDAPLSLDRPGRVGIGSAKIVNPASKSERRG